MLVADGAAGELGRAAARVATDRELGARLRTAGLARAAQFTWEAAPRPLSTSTSGCCPGGGDILAPFWWLAAGDTFTRREELAESREDSVSWKDTDELRQQLARELLESESELARARRRTAELELELDRLGAERDRLAASLTAVEEELGRMRATLSWRLTRPLRAGRRAARRLG